MERLGPTAFAARLAALDRESFAAFVAAVYRERPGHVPVDADGQPVRGGEGDGPADGRSGGAAASRRRVYVHADGTTAPPGVADVVVGRSGRAVPDGVDRVGPREFFDVVRYGLPPGTGDALCRDHLGGVPRAGGPAAGAGGRRWAGVARRRHAAAAVAVAAAVVIVGALAGAALVPGGTPAGPDSGPGAGSDPATATPGQTAVATTTPGPDSRPTAAGESGGAGVTARYRSLKPTCERPPDLVVAAQLSALRTEDGDNRGILVAYRFAAPVDRRAPGSVDRFVQVLRSDAYDELLAHEGVEYGPLTVANGTAVQPVAVVGPGGERTRFRFRLRRVTGGRYAGCWVTDGIWRGWNRTTTG